MLTCPHAHRLELNKFSVTGSLKSWSIEEKLLLIRVPTLLLDGAYDAAQDECLQPFFDKLDKVKWVQFRNSAHMPHIEEKERCIEQLGKFLVCDEDE